MKHYDEVPQFDLVEEAEWEDHARERGLLVSLEEAGLEESSEQPVFGFMEAESSRHGIYSYTDWFYDEDESAFSII